MCGERCGCIRKILNLKWDSKQRQAIIQSCNKQSYQADKYQTIKDLSRICESESSWSEQVIKWSFKSIKHVKIANQASNHIGSPCLKRGYPLIDRLNASFSSTSVQAWSSKSPTNSPICGPVFFKCVPTGSVRLAFLGEKLVLENSESPLLLFHFLKRKIKQERNP